MAKLILDVGNYGVKAIDPDSYDTAHAGQFTFRSAIARLTETQYQRNVRAGNPAVGYMRVNDIPYAYGDVALMSAIERPTGAARYTKTYYGVLAMAAIALAFNENPRTVEIIASHAPQDFGYRDVLRESIAGVWDIHTHRGRWKIKVPRPQSLYEEPLGGYMNAVFTMNGTPVMFGNEALIKRDLLVIDVGGFTTDIAPVLSGGNIVANQVGSVALGMNNVMREFTDALRASHPEHFKSSTIISPRKIQQALASGTFSFGGRTELDMTYERNDLLAKIANEIIDVVNARAGGFTSYDNVLLSGGGGYVLQTFFEANYPGVSFLLSDKQYMIFSNVRGAYKMLKLGVLA